MPIPDFKEVWQEEFDAAEERGEKDPGCCADEAANERFAHLADLARDAWKYRDV